VWSEVSRHRGAVDLDIDAMPMGNETARGLKQRNVCLRVHEKISSKL
jgi:hypothetical protein